jgi:hypothetical protein
MKKVIKLTERDLMNIVKRVINEQSLSLEAKLIEKGFKKNKNMLSKKITGVGDFYFNLKNNGAEITILNPNNIVISKFNSKFNSKSSNKIKLGFKPDIEAERLLDYIIKSFGASGITSSSSPSPMDEDRLDFGGMSDDELHDFHPEIKRHERHFKDFTPTSEYLGWRGEVDKRNLYKYRGKFHDAFDKKTED